MASCSEELIDQGEIQHQNFIDESVSLKNIYGSIIMAFSNFSANISSVHLFKTMMPLCNQGLQSNDWKA
jgi:hypothetical protein